MSSLLIILACSLAFRIRGGLDMPFTNKNFPLHKWYFATMFAFSACYLMGWDWGFLFTGFIAGKMSTSYAGWGSYIGALYTGVVNENDKDDLNITYFVQDKLFPWFNTAHEWCLAHKHFKWLAKIFPTGSYKDNGKLYGFITLSLRGGVTTFILGLSINSVWYMFIGLLQGAIYWFGGWLCRHVYNDGKMGWNWSEWLWGGTLGLFLVLCKGQL